MRVYDLPVKLLCNKHLQEQHDAIHIVRNAITNCEDSPETKRWKDNLWALGILHMRVVNEMIDRQMPHYDSIQMSKDCCNYPLLIDSIPDQINELMAMCNDCRVNQIIWRT